MIHTWLAPALLLVTLHAGAQSPVYKCEHEGKISYASIPCVGGVALPSAVATSAASPGKAGPEASSGHASQFGSPKHQQALAEQLARERHQREAQEQRDRQRSAARRLHCDKLRLHKQWRDEDVARASASARATLQRHARRAAEELALVCP